MTEQQNIENLLNFIEREFREGEADCAYKLKDYVVFLLEEYFWEDSLDILFSDIPIPSSWETVVRESYEENLHDWLGNSFDEASLQEHYVELLVSHLFYLLENKDEVESQKLVSQLNRFLKENEDNENDGTDLLILFFLECVFYWKTDETQYKGLLSDFLPSYFLDELRELSPKDKIYVDPEDGLYEIE